MGHRREAARSTDDIFIEDGRQGTSAASTEKSLRRGIVIDPDRSVVAANSASAPSREDVQSGQSRASRDKKIPCKHIRQELKTRIIGSIFGSEKRCIAGTAIAAGNTDAADVGIGSSSNPVMSTKYPITMNLVDGDEPDCSSLITGIATLEKVRQTRISKVYHYEEPVCDESGKYKCKL